MDKIKLLVILLLIFSCNKEDVVSNPVIIIPPKPPRIDFQGLTLTDFRGFIVSEDTNDWRFVDSFNPYVRYLFKMDSTVRTYKNDTLKFEPINIPSDTYLRIRINRLDYYTDFRYIVVDKNYNKLKSDSLLYGTSYQVILLDSSFTRGDTFRVFYKLVIGRKSFTGYGDFNRKK
jgi:hypothetical protein